MLHIACCIRRIAPQDDLQPLIFFLVELLKGELRELKGYVNF